MFAFLVVGPGLNDQKMTDLMPVGGLNFFCWMVQGFVGVGAVDGGTAVHATMGLPAFAGQYA